MERLWIGLVNNSVCMLVVLPMIGAVLVQAMRPFGWETVRRTALTNVVLSLFLLIVMVANFDVGNRTNQSAMQQQPHAQLRTNLRWTGGRAGSGAPNIQFAVGVDGISLWPIAAIVLLAFAAVTATYGQDGKQIANNYSAILLLQAALIGVVAALDVILFCVFLEFSVWPLAVLMGRRGDANTLTTVRRMCVSHSISSLLVMAGLVLMVLAYSWMRTTEANPNPPLVFSISELTAGISAWLADDRAAQTWNQVRVWVCFLVAAGLTIRSLAVPFHGWFLNNQDRSSIAVCILSPAVALPIAVYGIVRFVLPMFPEIAMPLAHPISIMLLASVVFLALLAVSSRGLGRLTNHACLLHSALCLLAVTSLSTLGVTGALIHSSSILLSAAAVFLLADRFPRIAAWRHFLLLLAVGAVLGIPGSSGFAGQLMILVGIFETDPMIALWTCFALLLLLWVFAVALLSGQSTDVPDPPADVNEGRGASLRTLAAVFPLLFVIGWLGLQPQFLMSRMNQSVAYVMRRYPATSDASADSDSQRPRRLSQQRRYRRGAVNFQ